MPGPGAAGYNAGVMTVYFIGAGPGDPELITIKGRRLLSRCPVVVYAGSLVPREMLEWAPDAEHIDSARLDLDAIIAIMERAAAEGRDVARLHSGDPSLYGAIGEQMRRLRALGIAHEVVPGVTATAASAAWLGVELTLPGVAQSVIFTRYGGKTAMPDGESLDALARSGATLAIHLGAARIHRIAAELRPHYGGDCPVAVCHRTSWPEQRRIIGTLDDIAARVRSARIRRTALILVGPVLGAGDFEDSQLYSPDGAHYLRPRHGRAAGAVERGVPVCGGRGK